MADVERLPWARASRFTPTLPLLWIEGQDLLGKGAVWVPLELVSTNYTLPLPPGSGCFQANTNGLASGNHWLEAVSHGLCEVVERDAATLWKHRPFGAPKERVIDPDTVDDAACREAIARLEAADLEVRMWEVTTDVGIPAFVCLLAGRDGDEDADPEFGSGCHPARHIALLRALVEAAQARNTYIAAARDDYFAHLYAPAHRLDRQEYCRHLLALAKPSHAFSHVAQHESPTIEGDLRWMLARLRAAGIDEVIAVDLTRDAIGIPVARVVVPGLEGLMDEADGDYAPGERARRSRRVAV